MNKTSIEWTDATWNPIRGCSRVSEGCRNCYAERVARRFGGKGQPYEGLVRINNSGERMPQWNGEVRLIEEHLLDPLKWKKSRRIFVNSMSDLFHENMPDEWIDRIFAVMALCPQHTFQVLTKRPERMLKYFYLSTDNREEAIGSQALDISAGKHSGILELPLPNVWPGVSVENQKTADERIPLLLQTPAAVWFISAEPLLEMIDIYQYLGGARNPIRGLNWVIVGGESGPKARPMHPDWVRSLRDQCQAAGVSFFFKQWGEWEPRLWMNQHGAPCLKISVPNQTRFKPRDKEIIFTCTDDSSINMVRVGKKAAGAMLDGREWREFPEVRA